MKNKKTKSVKKASPSKSNSTAPTPPPKKVAKKPAKSRVHLTHAVALVNIFELVAIVVMLLMAFSFQFLLKELPCPLCLIQRYGFLAIAFGFLMNLRFGFKPSHYSIVLLSAVFTAFVSLRQIALHVIPGSGSFGSTFLGYHLYTWSFIASVIIITVTSLALAFDHQYKPSMSTNNKWWRHASHSLFALVAFLLIANILSVLLECGLSICPDNPTRYFFTFFGS